MNYELLKRNLYKIKDYYLNNKIFFSESELENNKSNLEIDFLSLVEIGISIGIISEEDFRKDINFLKKLLKNNNDKSNILTKRLNKKINNNSISNYNIKIEISNYFKFIELISLDINIKRDINTLLFINSILYNKLSRYKTIKIIKGILNISTKNRINDGNIETFYAINSENYIIISGFINFLEFLYDYEKLLVSVESSEIRSYFYFYYENWFNSNEKELKKTINSIINLFYKEKDNCSKILSKNIYTKEANIYENDLNRYFSVNLINLKNILNSIFESEYYLWE